MAEGLLREGLRAQGLERRVLIASAGTNATQPGHPADGRAQQVCARSGIDLRRSRARQVVEDDFRRFDYLLAVDEPNRRWLADARPPDSRGVVSLLGSWAAPDSIGDIPDPYYGSPANFEESFELLRRCIDGFLPTVAARLEAQAR